VRISPSWLAEAAQVERPGPTATAVPEVEGAPWLLAAARAVTGAAVAVGVVVAMPP